MSGTLKRVATKNVATLFNEQIYKPGSVLDNHLSGTYVAIVLKPPLGTHRASAFVPFCGVAPDRVYRIA